MRRFNAIYNRKGFTLTEILVAMSLLLIILVAAAPLLVYIVQTSQANKVRLEATRIAGSEIERIRALPYSQVGNIGGSPSGVIERERIVVLNGVTFTVTTDVWWWDDPSDGLGGPGPGVDRIPYDYKRVSVSVTAPGLFSGAVTTNLDLDTLASLEGGEEAFPGGNIRLTAQRGWKTGPEEIPVAGTRVRLTAGTAVPQTLWTDNIGRALFAILAEGDYTVSLTAPTGMIVRPDQLNLSTTVTTGVTNELTVDVEYPVQLFLRLRDDVTGAPVANRTGTVTLVRPYGEESQFPFTSGANGAIDDIFGPLWPVGGAPEGHPGAYSLRIHDVAGYSSYDMANLHLNQVKPLLPDGRPWDGTFPAPNTHLELTVNLRPILYREPPFQPARVFEHLAVTGGELVLATAGTTINFRLSPVYASVDTPPESSRWRGYRFRVDVPLTVTHLIGGGNAAGFAGAIYEASGNRPVALLGSVSFTGAARQQQVALTNPVNLVSGQDYIIAQGRVTGSGLHHLVNRIDDDDINNDTHLSSWFPSSGDALRWDSTVITPLQMVNRNPDDTGNDNRPDLGFIFQTAGHHPSGVKISNEIALSEFVSAPELRVRWEALTPAGTALTVATAITNSTTTPAAAAFIPVENGALIPGITPGENLTGRYLWLRVALTTTVPIQTPRLRWLEVSF